MPYRNKKSLCLPKRYVHGLIITCFTLVITACNNSTSISPGSSPVITVSLSSTLPYSTSHAGIQTPVMILFSAAINPATVTNSSFYVESSGGKVAGSVSVGSDNESATFTPSGPMDYGTTYTIYATASIVDSSGNTITPLTSGNTFMTQAESYTIFASTTTTGQIGSGGIEGADNMCNTDINCSSFAGGCKAMLVDDAGTRVAAPIPVNWVLQPYSAYHGLNNLQLGGITGIVSNGSPPTNVPLNSSVFGFDLPNNFLKSSSEWTGMNTDWTTAIGNTCNNWGSTSGNGTFGNGGSIESTFIANGAPDSCNNTYYLYCVEQP